jgi:hypothetical protein
MRMPDKNSRNVTDPLAQLNQAQRAAVTFGIDQHQQQRTLPCW